MGKMDYKELFIGFAVTVAACAVALTAYHFITKKDDESNATVSVTAPTK